MRFCILESHTLCRCPLDLESSVRVWIQVRFPTPPVVSAGNQCPSRRNSGEYYIGTKIVHPDEGMFRQVAGDTSRNRIRTSLGVESIRAGQRVAFCRPSVGPGHVLTNRVRMLSTFITRPPAPWAAEFEKPGRGSGNSEIGLPPPNRTETIRGLPRPCSPDKPL